MVSPFAAHERSNGTGFSPVEITEVGGSGTSKEFGRKCNDDNQNGIAPRNSGVEGSKVSVETGQREILRMNQIGGLRKYKG
jgi:hypothetical protein